MSHKTLTVSITDPSDDDLANIGIKAKKAFMFKAEAAFHKAWQDAQAWIASSPVSGQREFVASVPVVTINYEPCSAARTESDNEVQ